MKKSATISLMTASFLIILTSIGFWDSLVIFLFAGIIPVINVQLSPGQMLGLLLIIASLIVVRYNQPDKKVVAKKKNRPKTRRLSHV